MYQDRINQVTALLEGYPDIKRKIAVLRYELEHPATVSPDEMIEALSFARGDEEGRSSGHISNKTLYIAMSYQTEAAQLSSEAMDEITRQLIPLEREINRLEHHVSLLTERQAAVIRLYYFEANPWERVAQMRGISVRAAQLIRNEAVRELVAMYTLSNR